MLAHASNLIGLAELTFDEIELIAGGGGTIVVEDCTPGVAPTYKED